MTYWQRRSGIALALVALTAGCSDGGGGAEAASTPAAPEGVECVNLPDCAVEASRTEGLVDGDVISIRIEGWEPETAVGIGQCSDADDADNPAVEVGPDGLPPADVCNVEGLGSAAQAETSDADGVLAFDYQVRAGETMVAESAQGQCDAEHDCRLHLFWNFDLRLRADAQRVSIPLTFA